MRNTVVSAVVLPASFAIGVHWQLNGLAASWLIAVPITCAINLPRTATALGLTLAQIGAALRGPVLGGCLMHLAVLGGRLLLQPLTQIFEIFGGSEQRADRVHRAKGHTEARHCAEEASQARGEQLPRPVRGAEYHPWPVHLVRQQRAAAEVSRRFERLLGRGELQLAGVHGAEIDLIASDEADRPRQDFHCRPPSCSR